MSDVTDSADRPALKRSGIEVTPEMIEAGIDELRNWFPSVPASQEISIVSNILSAALHRGVVP